MARAAEPQLALVMINGIAEVGAMQSPEEIARAFSSHRFTDTYAHLAPDVRWVPVGASTMHGREAVIEACEASSAYLADVTTTFTSFRTIVGADAVVVDSLAEYVDAAGETSVVASCDIYDVVDGVIVAITSYAVELDAD